MKHLLLILLLFGCNKKTPPQVNRAGLGITYNAACTDTTAPTVVRVKMDTVTYYDHRDDVCCLWDSAKPTTRDSMCVSYFAKLLRRWTYYSDSTKKYDSWFEVCKNGKYVKISDAECEGFIKTSRRNAKENGIGTGGVRTGDTTISLSPFKKE